MRIVQIIDSLEAGGAERMAVNYANGLAEMVDFSGLIATRKEGDLKEKIDPKVKYLFLKKKNSIDIFALFKLKKYCKTHNIGFIQAHSSSFFIAVLLKILSPKIKIIWHDHDGMSEYLHQRKSFFLKIASFYFDGIITVNLLLKDWALTKLNCKKVFFLPNFTSFDANEKKLTRLNGVDGKRILCLANLRQQKNHFMLIKIAVQIKNIFPNWSFHLVGKDFQDHYSQAIKKLIIENNLQKHVYIYGSKKDIQNIINQSSIGVLTSNSEGLPVCLLEFGLQKKPVVATNVGEIGTIIKNNSHGFLVERKDDKSFLEAVLFLIKDENAAVQKGENLNFSIEQNHSKNKILDKYINWLMEYLKC
jgi:glycosyltransferase involved in cell wall biosynthesis